MLSSNGKYVLDLNDLQYKLVRLPFRKKVIRFFSAFLVSVVIFIGYKSAFTHFFGCPKEARLMQEIEIMKLDLMMVDRQIDNAFNRLNDFRLSDDRRYRPVLSMDTLPGSYRQPAFGGVERYRELSGLMNSSMLISMSTRLDQIKSLAKLQTESFIAVAERTREWKRQMEYLPIISPVNVNHRRGDGYKFREKHPVHGNPQWHHGQDFSTPVGTPVYATGAGTIIEAGWNTGGFGNHVVIDHGYGYRTTYGHLSSVKVSSGTNVKRGDLIGLSGNTGISSGPHLHYQIDFFGRTQNPLHFFNDDLTPEEYLEMIKILSAGTVYR